MPSFKHGKLTSVYFDVTDFSPYLNSSAVTATVDVAETTAFGSTGGKTFITGIDMGTLSMQGMFSGLAGEIEPIVTAAIGQDTPDNNISFGYQGGTILGNRASLAAVHETSVGITAPVNGVVTLTLDSQVDGGTDFGWYLNSVATVLNANIIPAGGNSVDTTLATRAGGAVAHLHVIANTLNQSFTASIQDSGNNSAFLGLTSPLNFATVNAGTTSSQRISTLTVAQRYLALNITGLTGPTGSATIVVSVAKRS